MNRLIFVTQAVDPEHPVLGATLPKIRALAARVETTSAEYGFERENRRWSGHLTIGRVRDTQHLGAATREALEAAKEIEFGVSKIESITLYRSHLAPEGASYEALATFLFHHR